MPGGEGDESESEALRSLDCEAARLGWAVGSAVVERERRMEVPGLESSEWS